MNEMWGEKVRKGVRWMPRLLQAMKDVVSCEKPGRGANDLWHPDFRMGQPGRLKTCHHINYGANAGNWNILVPVGRENKRDTPSSGERRGHSPNRRGICFCGVVGLPRIGYKNEAERFGKVGHSGWQPLMRKFFYHRQHLSISGHVKSWENPAGPSAKAKYS